MYQSCISKRDGFIDLRSLMRCFLPLPTVVMVVNVMVCIVALTIADISSRATFVTDFANAFVPASLAASLSYTAYLTARQYPVFVWTSCFWFLIGCVVFFGFGPLIFVLGNDDTLAYLATTQMAPSEYELLRTNLLNAVGILVVLASMYVLLNWRQLFLIRTGSRTIAANRSAMLKAIAVSFIIVGGALRFTVFLPYQFGQGGPSMPGFIVNLQYLFLLGIVVLAYIAAKERAQSWRLVFLLLWVSHLAVTLLEFNKSAMMTSIILPALAVYLAIHKRKILVIAALLSLVTFFLMQPLVLKARESIRQETGMINQATLTERIDIVLDVLEDRSSLTTADEREVNYGWARLSYAAVQAFGMHQYETGFNGETLRRAWMILVPRMIWPDKPSMSMGSEFYELMRGRTGSSLGLTIFGNGYWEFGWVGVVLFSMIVAFLHVITTRWAVLWLTTERLIFLPAIIIMILMGAQINGFLLTNLLGPFVILVAYICVIRAGAHFIYAAKRRV